ncbi:MAG: hypothetical protein O3B64_04080 [bacterium]|nr:hypothetical protein [bacterium]
MASVVYEGKEDFERRVRALQTKKNRKMAEAEVDLSSIGIIPRMIAHVLFVLFRIFYGKQPSPLKFKAIEVLARIPYQSWESLVFVVLTVFFSNEQLAIRLGKLGRFASIAQENETMHVVVISHLARKQSDLIRGVAIPAVSAFFYYWFCIVFALVSKKWALELNVLFENHAYYQYDTYLSAHAQNLKANTCSCDYLTFYGRNPKDLHEFFELVRNDELIHRNMSAALLTDIYA